MILRLAGALLALLFSFQLFSQQSAEKAWISGQYKTALESYQKSAKSNPEAILAQSLIYSETGDIASAIDYYLSYSMEEKDQIRRNTSIDALWKIDNDVLTNEQIKFYEQEIENPYGRISTLALYELGKHYKRVNKLEKAKGYFSRLGVLDTWSIVGEFENISESGFDKDFGVLDKPKSSAKFVNKQGAEVTWFPGYLQQRGWLNLKNHFFMNNSIAYAQTFCQSPKDQEVFFRFGSSGSAKIWLNDQLLFSTARELDNHFDTHVFKATLKSGYNRILVQIGNTTVSSANFALRITDNNNLPIKGLNYQREYQEYQKQSGKIAELIPDPTISYLKDRIENKGERFIDYLLLANLYLTNDFNEELIELIQKGLKKYPNNVELYKVLQIALNSTQNETGASAIKKKIQQLSPTSSQALSERFEKAQSTKDWDEYARTLDDWKATFPDDKITLRYEITLAGGLNDVEKIISLINEGYERFPEDFDFIKAKANLIREYNKEPKKATAFLNKSLNQYFSSAVIEELINTYWEEGNTQKVLTLFEQLKAYFPAAPNYYLREAKVYEITKEYDKMDTVMEELLRRAPYIDVYYKEYGKLLERRGDKKEALKMYAQAIELNPYDYESRNAQRNLKGLATTAFKDFPKIDYYEAYSNSPSAEEFPDDHSAILRYDVSQVIHPGGGNEMRIALLVKVFNNDGIETWKEYTIGVGSDQTGNVEKVEILDPDGNRREASRNGADVVFDGLQPDGAILLVYRLQETQKGRLIGKFWNNHPLELSYPSVASTYRLLAPDNLDFDYTVTGINTENTSPKIEQFGNKKMYSWVGENHPGFLPENSSPSYSEIEATVRVSNIKSWDFIADWYAELTHAKIQPDDVVRRKTEELFAGTSGLSQREEVEMIYEYIANEIRYISVSFLQSGFVPQRASKTINTGQGDCKDVSSLFVSMCELRGIKANLVLINTRDRSHINLSLPSINFNHCIAYVELDGTPYFIELTDENLPFGTGDWSLNNSFALIIPRVGESLIRPAGLINPASRGNNESSSKAAISFEGGKMKYLVDYQVTNASTSGIRNTFENESKANQEKRIKEWLGQEFSKATLDELSFQDNLHDNSNKVNYSIGFTIEDAANTIGGMDIYELHIYNQFSSAPAYIATDTRKLPLDVWNSFTSETHHNVSTIANPEGKSLVEKPNDVSVTNDYFEYRLTFKKEGKTLVVDRYFNLKKDTIPVEDYPEFREALLKVVAADKISLAYR